MRIVSGGQTGVDRAALDAALALGFPCGGWCPRGRLAEDGVLDARYPLRETASKLYRERTLRNVVDSDATLLLAAEPLNGGTLYTLACVREVGRPYLRVDPGEAGASKRVAEWVRASGVRTLNVAGPRESKSPGAYRAARILIEAVLRAVSTR